MTFSPGKATTRNVFWAYLSFASTKALNLVAIILVARYVDPVEFGLMAICLAIMGYFEIISQFGLGAALISAPDREEETANAVFICAMVISSTMAILLWALSGPIAQFYGSPALQDLLTVIAAALVIRALTTVQSSLLFRELRLRDKIVPDVVRGLTKGLVSIALAILGYGVWALALGYLASAVAGSIALAIVRPWRPTGLPSVAMIRHVMRFGAHLIGAETINSTPRLLDNLLVGKFLGPAALGIYALAFRIPELGIKSFTTVAGSVLHPVMSKIQADPAELRIYFYQSLRYCALIMFGIGAAIAVLSGPLVHVLYSPKWYDMVVPMQIIAVAFAISTLNMVPGKLLKAVSRTDLLFRVSLINLPLFVGVIALAVPHGIEAVAAAQLVLAFVRFVPTFHALKRVMDINVKDTLRALGPALLCTGTATIATLVSLQLVEGAELTRLLTGAATFSIFYLTMLRFTVPEVFEAGSRVVLRRRRT